jgi:hypothetical protein
MATSFASGKWLMGFEKVDDDRKFGRRNNKYTIRENS